MGFLAFYDFSPVFLYFTFSGDSSSKLFFEALFNKLRITIKRIKVKYRKRLNITLTYLKGRIVRKLTSILQNENVNFRNHVTARKPYQAREI